MNKTLKKIGVAFAAVTIPLSVIAQDEEERPRPERPQRPDPETMAKQIMEKYDKNTDQMLSMEELVAYLKDMRTRRPGAFRRGGPEGGPDRPEGRPRGPRGPREGDEGADDGDKEGDS